MEELKIHLSVTEEALYRKPAGQKKLLHAMNHPKEGQRSKARFTHQRHFHFNKILSRYARCAKFTRHSKEPLELIRSLMLQILPPSRNRHLSVLLWKRHSVIRILSIPGTCHVPDASPGASLPLLSPPLGGG